MNLIDIGPAGLVLFAALMHASWNAVVKAGSNRLIVLAALKVPTMIIGAVLLVIEGPPAVESVPYALGSATAFCGYAFFLLRGYGAGDLNFVYPIARGTAPLFVAIGAAFVLGEWLTTGEMIGFGAICAGLLLLASGGRQGGSWAAASAALAVSFFIGIYTLLDGIGGRLSGNALAYTALGNLLSGIPLLAYVYLRGASDLHSYLRQRWLTAAFGGSLMFLTYALVIFAMTLAPLAHIAALRETSVVFAAIIGALILKERAGWRRAVASLVVAAGIVILLLSSGGQGHDQRSAAIGSVDTDDRKKGLDT